MPMIDVTALAGTGGADLIGRAWLRAASSVRSSQARLQHCVG
jgi:hypothetical protein